MDPDAHDSFWSTSGGYICLCARPINIHIILHIVIYLFHWVIDYIFPENYVSCISNLYRGWLVPQRVVGAGFFVAVCHLLAQECCKLRASNALYTYKDTLGLLSLLIEFGDFFQKPPVWAATRPIRPIQMTASLSATWLKHIKHLQTSLTVNSSCSRWWECVDCVISCKWVRQHLWVVAKKSSWQHRIASKKSIRGSEVNSKPLNPQQLLKLLQYKNLLLTSYTDCLYKNLLPDSHRFQLHVPSLSHCLACSFFSRSRSSRHCWGPRVSVQKNWTVKIASHSKFQNLTSLGFRSDTQWARRKTVQWRHWKKSLTETKKERRRRYSSKASSDCSATHSILPSLGKVCPTSSAICNRSSPDTQKCCQRPPLHNCHGQQWHMPALSSNGCWG